MRRRKSHDVGARRLAQWMRKGPRTYLQHALRTGGVPATQALDSPAPGLAGCRSLLSALNQNNCHVHKLVGFPFPREEWVVQERRQSRKAGGAPASKAKRASRVPKEDFHGSIGAPHPLVTITFGPLSQLCSALNLILREGASNFSAPPTAVTTRRATATTAQERKRRQESRSTDTREASQP